jgi:hypothetical protein
MAEELVSNVGVEIMKPWQESSAGKFVSRDHFAFVTQATGSEWLVRFVPIEASIFLEKS